MSMYNVVVPFVAKWEGLKLCPYYCSADHLTIGYGEVIRNQKYYGKYLGKDLKTICRKIRSKNSRYRANKIIRHTVGNLITAYIAREDFKDSLKINYWYGIRRVLPKGLNDNQCAALLSLAYNIGIYNFRSSTLVRKLNTGDFIGASNEFVRWNKARVKGKLTVIRGLTRRRLAEKALFLKE